MAKPKKPSAQPSPRDVDDVKTRRRGGRLEFFDKHQKRWIERKVIPSLLDRLVAEGRINEDAYQAGLRFQVRFEMAGLSARYGSIAPDAIIVDGGRQWHEPMGGSETARREVADALDHVGEFGADCLAWLLGMDEGIEAFTWRCRGNGRLIHRQAVQFALITALGSLVSYYRRERRHGEGR